MANFDFYSTNPVIGNKFVFCSPSKRGLYSYKDKTELAIGLQTSFPEPDRSAVITKPNYNVSNLNLSSISNLLILNFFQSLKVGQAVVFHKKAIWKPGTVLELRTTHQNKLVVDVKPYGQKKIATVSVYPVNVVWSSDLVKAHLDSTHGNTGVWKNFEHLYFPNLRSPQK